MRDTRIPLIAAAMLAGLSSLDAASSVRPRAAQTRRTPSPTDIYRRHYGMTQAQAEWNAAVDAKRKQKATS